MKYLSFLWLIVSVLVFSADICFSQDTALTNTVVQLKYSALVDSANSDISAYRNLDKSNKENIRNPQAIYADKFYSFYKKYPNTEAGKNAVVTAFKFWLNVDALPQMKNALSKVPINSDLWSELVVWTQYAYSNNDKGKKFMQLLKKWKLQLTNPKSRNFVAKELGDYYFYTNNFEKATKYYRKVISLSVDSFDVVAAKRNLYEITSLSVGDKAPNFKATTLDGDTIKLTGLRGKVIVLEFWATWCGPCIPEIPYLKELNASFGNRKDFVLIGISLDKNIEKLKKFLKEKNITWVQICDEKKWDSKLAKLYNANSGIPKSYVINEKGIIVFKDLRKDKLKEAVSSLLK